METGSTYSPGQDTTSWSDAEVTTFDDVDLDAAMTWATTHIGSIAGVRRLEGGWTSTMVCLTTERGDEAVLRLMTKEPWRSHGVSLTTREHEVQQLLVDEAVPAPRTIALDAEGTRCHHPAHLMSMLPGSVDVDRVDDDSLDRLVQVLLGIHRVEWQRDVRTYQSWAWEAKYVVPSWATDPAVWSAAFDLLRGPVPDYEPRFIHRDFQLRNVLWSGPEPEPSGVVDWVETSTGPAWLDVAHCSTNIAIRHGSERADAFATAYADAASVEAQPFFDVMDVVGFLPPPGKQGFVSDPVERVRLEQRLRVVLQRV